MSAPRISAENAPLPAFASVAPRNHSSTLPVDDTLYVKRIIGKPGDLIEMIDNVLVVNGKVAIDNGAPTGVAAGRPLPRQPIAGTCR